MLKDQLSKEIMDLENQNISLSIQEQKAMSRQNQFLKGLRLMSIKLKSMGVRAETLVGVERLKLLHDMLNPDKSFEYDGYGLEKRYKEPSKTQYL